MDVRRSGLLALAAVAPFVASGASCRGSALPAAPAHAPQRLIGLPPLGPPPLVAEVKAGGVTRRSILSSARYSVYLPTKGVLAFSLAARAAKGVETRGFLHATIRVDGRNVGVRQINPRTEHAFRDMTVEFDGPGQPGQIEIDLSLRNGRGEALSPHPNLILAIGDPLLLDVSALNDRRGVVLISIDTLRRDHLGLYGHEKPTSPTLDEMGRRGLVAEDAVSVSSWTLPAHFSMVTSVDPAAHGAVDPEHAFNRRFPTLGSVFQKAGWLTHAITSQNYVSPQFGFDEGFDGFDYAFDRPAEEVADRALSFLDHVGPRPFFLFLHFYGAHLDYKPPEHTLRLMEPTPYTGDIAGTRPSLFEHTSQDRIDPKDLDHVRALYDGEIRHIDDQLSRVFERLKELGLDRSTLLAVTSDHGEEFLDHDSWEHRATLYEELIRIPLFFKGPGVETSRISTQASLLDVAPTILDWAHQPPLPAARGQSLLRPLPKDRETYGETAMGARSTRKVFLRGGASKWKTVLSFRTKDGAPAGEEWFDLATDPEEKHSDSPPKAAAGAIRARLMRRWQEGRMLGQSARPVNLSPEELEQLRALGYVR